MAAKENGKEPPQPKNQKDNSALDNNETLVFTPGNKNTGGWDAGAGGQGANDQDGAKEAGWNDQKYVYTDRNVQALVKEGGGAKNDGAKTDEAAKGGARNRPQHRPRIQFKPSEALRLEAAKVDDFLTRLIVRCTETEAAVSKGKAQGAGTRPGSQGGVGAKANDGTAEQKNTKLQNRSKSAPAGKKS